MKDRGTPQVWDNDEAHAYYDGLVAARKVKSKTAKASPLPF